MVSNALGSKNVSCVVQVTPILEQVLYRLTPRHWPLGSTTPFQASVFVADSNPGPITITWDFGDSTVLSAPRAGTIQKRMQ
jgi:hypothetical protein